MIIQSDIALHFRCCLTAVMAQQQPHVSFNPHAFNGEGSEHMRLNRQHCSATVITL